MGFSTSLMPKTHQITHPRLVIWQDFLAFVMWKKPYSHFLLTVFSQCSDVYAETKSRLHCIIFVESPLVGVQWRHCVVLLRSCELFSLLGKIKVINFRMNLWNGHFSQNMNHIIVRISAFYCATLQGRIPYNFWFIFWKIFLKFTDL